MAEAAATIVDRVLERVERLRAIQREMRALERQANAATPEGRAALCTYLALQSQFDRVAREP